MTLERYTFQVGPAIEAELQMVVKLANQPGLQDLSTILVYHMGWDGIDQKPEARGKRIRPLLLLLCASATGADWKDALPAAAGIELLHNFSLVHDDIQDKSDLRRGRETVWKIWGIEQAINVGDTLFVLAHQSVLRLAETISLQVCIQAMNIFDAACLALTQGQFLDISYEKRSDLSMEDYWPMVAGKTAALLSSCTEIGALIGQVEPEKRHLYKNFGRDLGLAFQVQDDLLGIWGDSVFTGKSAESDLVSGKNSLPVLFGLEMNGPFARRWSQGNIQPAEVEDLANQLEAEGAREFTQVKAQELTDQALQALQYACPTGEAGIALHQLAAKLLKRAT